MNISVQQMRALVAVADLRSFTGAARRLHVTQPAISRAITETERQLGLSVFDRSTRPLRPTDRGDQVIAVARQVLECIEHAAVRIEEISNTEHRTLRIAALPTVAAILLPKVAAHLRDIGADIDLHIFASVAEGVSDMVNSGEVDVGISVLSDAYDLLAFQPIIEDELICAAPKGHRFSAMSTIEWSDLSAETVVRLPVDSSVGSLTEKVLTTCGIVPKRRIATLDLMSAAGLAAAGMGVAVIPATATPMTRFAEVSYTSICSPTTTRSIGMLSKSELGLDAKLILSKSRDVARDLVAHALPKRS